MNQDRYRILLSKYRRLISEYKKSRKKERNKMQFSQKICVFGLSLILAAWLGNGLLLWFGREAMSDVTIAIITMFGGFATGGYFALSGVRDCSKNKWGIKGE